jgi:hypothetical protein
MDPRGSRSGAARSALECGSASYRRIQRAVPNSGLDAAAPCGETTKAAAPLPHSKARLRRAATINIDNFCRWGSRKGLVSWLKADGVLVKLRQEISMRRYPSMAAACMGLIAVGPVSGRAQDAAPAAEIFVGGSKLWEHAGGSVYAGLYHNSGVKVAATGNFNQFLGLETDLVKFQDIPPTDYFRIMFGPHFAYNASSRVSPFAHALLGLTRQRLCPPTSACFLRSEEVGRNAFTIAIGGGLDVKVFRFFWLRPLQVDYVHVFFPSAPENNLQLSFGFTLRFGSAGKTGKH